jgi:hypothetical protein
MYFIKNSLNNLKLTIIQIDVVLYVCECDVILRFHNILLK